MKCVTLLILLFIAVFCLPSTLGLKCVVCNVLGSASNATPLTPLTTNPLDELYISHTRRQALPCENYTGPTGALYQNYTMECEHFGAPLQDWVCGSIKNISAACRKYEHDDGCSTWGFQEQCYCNWDMCNGVNPPPKPKGYTGKSKSKSGGGSTKASTMKNPPPNLSGGSRSPKGSSSGVILIFVGILVRQSFSITANLVHL